MKDPKYLGIPNINFSLTDKKDTREKAYSKQRKERGFDNSETWSLFNTISSFIYPRLKAFRDIGCGTPMGLEEKEWLKILDKMLYSFDFINNKYDSFDNTEEDYKKLEEGLQLFTEHFFSLWN